MESYPVAIALARASCQRCHRRKKKCDRALPQCENCQLAGVTCSFLDNDQVGTYPIAFVQGLQQKIKDLERTLAETSQQPDSIPLHHAPSSDELSLLESTLLFSQSDGFQFDLPQPAELSPATGQSASLVEELRLLSLEATAERHLGTSSGVSFAKLTQMVLLRLAPDKAEFVFENTAESTSHPQHHNAASPDNIESIVHDFSSSLSCYPTLFTGIPLSNITESRDILSDLGLPDEPHLTNLVDFYFAHSHTLYPIVNRIEFLSTLDQIRLNSGDTSGQSPLCLFRVWMVLAIGSTTYCSISLVEESEPMSYYNKAMLYHEDALGYGGMATLEVLTLQVSYSFFNQLGPNTWFLVGVAARIAVGMGLHTSSSYDNLPADVTERRKRIFFSIYMMDRVVSMALGRPCAIHDDDIDITPFADVDDEYITPEGIRPPSSLQPSIIAIPLHILSLRRIASKISSKVYSSVNAARTSTQEREQIILSLHKELIDWRRNMPFPLPDMHPHVPHTSGSWYDFNFYTHLSLLYRPSPLFPSLDKERVRVLADAAAMSIRQAVNMHRQHRLAYNWLNFLSLFTATLSLVYAITAHPDSLVTVLKQSKAINDLEAAMELFEILSIKFPAANKIHRMVEQIVLRYKDIRGE